MTDVKKRVPTGQLVTIGQHWRRRSRKRQEKYTVQIVQVHRGQDREVEAVVIRSWIGGQPIGREGARMRIRFSELRTKYMLVEQ